MKNQFKLIENFLKDSNLGYTLDNFSDAHFYNNTVLLIFTDFDEACKINENFILSEKYNEAFAYGDIVVEFSTLPPRLQKY
jgi:hypothetical protein